MRAGRVGPDVRVLREAGDRDEVEPGGGGAVEAPRRGVDGRGELGVAGRGGVHRRDRAAACARRATDSGSSASPRGIVSHGMPNTVGPHTAVWCRHVQVVGSWASLARRSALPTLRTPPDEGIVLRQNLLTTSSVYHSEPSGEVEGLAVDAHHAAGALGGEVVEQRAVDEAVAGAAAEEADERSACGAVGVVHGRREQAAVEHVTGEPRRGEERVGAGGSGEDEQRHLSERSPAA